MGHRNRVATLKVGRLTSDSEWVGGGGGGGLKTLTFVGPWAVRVEQSKWSSDAYRL